MTTHMWMAVGSAQMNEAQVARWCAEEQPAEHTEDVPLEIMVTAIVCLRCDRRHGEAPAHCKPMSTEQTFPHRWVSHMTVVLTDDEVESWIHPEADEIPLTLSANNVFCTLCGQQANRADDECPERRSWLGPASEDISWGELEA